MSTLKEIYLEIQDLKKKMVNPYFTAAEAVEFMKLGDKVNRYELKWLVAEGHLNEFPRSGRPVYSRAECEALLPRLDAGLLPSSKDLREYFKTKKAA